MKDSPKGPAERSGARSPGTAPAVRRGLTQFLGMLFLGAVVFAVYYPATRAPFIFDDAATIVDNPAIRRLWPLVGSGETAGPLNSSQGTPIHGRPLVGLSFAVNYYFGELDPYGYHLVNIVIHVLSTVLLWRIVARTLRLDFFQRKFDRSAEWVSFGTAFVWALHPVNTESVVYVTQRTELLMGLFYLATLYCSIRYWAASHKAAKVAILAAATVACASGMLSKEMMASAPAMVLLYERTFVAGSFRRALERSWPLYVCLALTWFPLLALNQDGPRTPAAGFGLEVAAHEWWFTQAKVLFLYLKLAIWPWPLVIHYEIPYLKTVGEAWPWLLAAGLLVLGTLILFLRRTSAGFVAVWFFAVLSPTLVIPLVTETAAERRMYVPLAALVPLLIVGGYAVLRRACEFAARRVGHQPVPGLPITVFSVAVIALLIAFGYLTDKRLAVYEDELALWQDTVAHQPHNPLARQNVGILLAESGQVSEAIPHLEEAVRLDPDSSRAQYNLAKSFAQTGLFQDAVEHYEATLKLCPEHAMAHYNLAELLVGAGQTQQAIEHLREAVAARPEFPAAHANLGGLLMASGRTQEGLDHLQTALEGERNARHCISLAWGYAQLNRLDKAIPLAEEALELARKEGDSPMIGQIEAMLRSYRLQRALQ